MQKLSRRRVAEYAAERLVHGESPMKLATYLAAYLADRKQTKQVELLLGDIQRVLAERHGVVLAEVTTSSTLSDDLRRAVRQLVESTHDPRQVILNEKTDPEIIGGVTVETSAGYYDGSVRKKLRNLQAMHKEN